MTALPALLWALAWSCSGEPGSGGSGLTADMVHIDDAAVGGAGGYWIDRYEYPNTRGEKPEVYVDMGTAAQRCAQVGKRLCTAAEWRRACLGPQGDLRYGYGKSHEAGRCHTEGRLPSGHTSMMDPKELIAASGAFPDCETAEGVVDMVGNAEEWVLADWRGIGGMLEGGAWYTWVGYADCSGAYSREPDYRLDPDRAVFSAGFRCCWSETAPTAEALTPDAIAADARARLGQARAGSSTAAYDPTAEVEVAGGIYMDVYEYPNRQGEIPRTAVSWVEAQGLCEAAGKRLCSAYEWEHACAGPKGRRYPYGDRLIEGACAVSLAQRPAAGQAYACVSPAGVQDLVGSTWEWTASRLEARALGTARGEVLREIRGGSWITDPVKGVCEPYDGYPVAPEDSEFPDLGFRCCRGEPVNDPVRAVPGSLRCPDDMVAIDAPSGPVCVDRYEEPNRAGAMPTTNLSLADARELCAARGRHVCTEDEWMAACAGPARRRWPYGNEYEPERCADSADQAPGIGGTTEPSGSKEGCVTPEGAFDMSGNLWEWTTDERGKGLLHGGGWNISAGLNQCRAVAQAAETHRIPEFGVRCCASPEEAAKLVGP